MGDLRSRTFCCCIPVRYCVLIMSMLGCIGGSVMSGFGWDSAVHKDETYLTTNQEVSVVMASLSYTLFAAISLLGVIGTVTRNRSFVSLYSTAVWSHLALNVISGAYFIYTLFHKVSEDDLNNCIASYEGDLISQFTCAKEFEIYRHVIITIYLVIVLFELCVCLAVASYIMQLREEEALGYPPPAQTAAVLPSMATTYNYRKEYAFTQPASSFGQNQNKFMDV
ncbi:hypothetical protein BGY98DRAFT_912943 [Russula aff. rugulosa BPL654]|nr:hypothetical protein BGY98DRAFT_912943 [Russula aff. rugulosa BPL654]